MPWVNNQTGQSSNLAPHWHGDYSGQNHTWHPDPPRPETLPSTLFGTTQAAPPFGVQATPLPYGMPAERGSSASGRVGLVLFCGGAGVAKALGLPFVPMLVVGIASLLINGWILRLASRRGGARLLAALFIVSQVAIAFYVVENQNAVNNLLTKALSGKAAAAQAKSGIQPVIHARHLPRRHAATHQRQQQDN